MEKTTLGKLVDERQQRDAIHVAVAPVVAAVPLSPGDHVGLTADGLADYHVKTPIGIVDPFLREVVQKGERFLLCLYPESITSLRHEWTHPAFGPEALVRHLAAKGK